MTESEYVTSQKGSDASESSEDNFLSSDDEGTFIIFFRIIE